MVNFFFFAFEYVFNGFINWVVGCILNWIPEARPQYPGVPTFWSAKLIFLILAFYPPLKIAVFFPGFPKENGIKTSLTIPLFTVTINQLKLSITPHKITIKEGF